MRARAVEIRKERERESESGKSSDMRTMLPTVHLGRARNKKHTGGKKHVVLCESDVVTMTLSVPWYGPEGVPGAPYGHGCCAGGAVAYWDACGSRVSGHGSAICTRARAHVAL